MYEKLFVFDFDGTIFASPLPPDDWKGGWWSKPVSLEYPNIPEKPDSKWYNSSVVSTAKKAISDPKILAVMMTGRQAIPDLMKRVKWLCKNQGLVFDEMHFSTSRGRSYKYDRIRQILAENPSIIELQVWDDANHDQFRKMFLTLPDTECKLHALRRIEPPTLEVSGEWDR